MIPEPTLVAIADSGQAAYPRRPPFHSHVAFPELPYGRDQVDPTNHIYGAVRELLHLLGLDLDHYGTRDWNPLGEIVHPGDQVVIKPNFVREATREETDFDAIVTHGSVLRPIVDYCQIAFRGTGNLAIADSPQFDSDFDKIVESNGTRSMVDWLNSVAPVHVDLLDLRRERVEYEGNVIVRRHKLAGDPNGYSIVNLGASSEFANLESLVPKLYGADYDTDETQRHHSLGVHEYLVSRTVLQANAVICVPKLKTHKKAGITVSLKNVIGIIGDKNYLPHHRIGSESSGGDEFMGNSVWKIASSSFYNTIFRLMAKLPATAKMLKVPGKAYTLARQSKLGGYDAGNWYGNDTIWRTILDLNKILFYARTDGRIDATNKRRYLTIVDGVIAGEREGPLDPQARPTGLVLAGIDPVVVDMSAARLMGFDYKMIPSLREALRQKQLELGGAHPDQIRVRSNDPMWELLWRRPEMNLSFRPHDGWVSTLGDPKKQQVLVSSESNRGD